MAQSAKVVSLKQVISRYPLARDVLLKKQESVICRSRESGKVKHVQFRALFQNNPRFWERSTSWEYFIDRTVFQDVLDTIRSIVEASRLKQRSEGNENPVAVPAEPTPPAPVPAAASEAANFGEDYEEIEELPAVERPPLIQQRTARLAQCVLSPDTTPDEAAAAVVAATGDTTMVNRATLMEALRLGDDQARAYTEEVVKETTRMVKTSIRLVDSEIYNDELVQALVQKSNGTVVQHMTRVFLMGLEFLLFYNHQVVTRGIANRIRIRFKRDYKRYYRQLLSHLHDDYVSLEHVFLGGMKSLSEIELTRFATGFLVHDVGKAEDIEYHEGDAGYDRNTVERHVKLGYKAVMDKTNYPREAALITGYHHEYYGDPHGYGYFREFLASYKGANPAAEQDYVMAYTMEPVLDYQVLAYFPAKMLEVVDVFDSLTDPNRKYRSPLTPEEACTMIREEFVEKQLKVDPIIYDLFLEFLDQRRPRAAG